MTIDHREMRWAMALAALVMAATCLPYIFGLLITPPGMRYMGLLGNPDDQNVYMAWMRQAADGRLLFTDLFTSEPQRAGFVHVYFLCLGWIARLTHAPLIWVYHLARIACGWLLLVLFYAFCAAFTDKVQVRRLALLLAAFSSGLGWLFYFILPPGSPHPADFGRGLVMPEAVTFLTLLLNPLFAFSVALMLAAFLLSLLAAERNSLRLALWAGLAALLLGNAHTYDMFTVYAVLAVYGAVLLACKNFRGVGLLILVAALSAPSVLYQAWLFRTNLVFRAKALTPTPSPPFLMMLLTFGIPLLFAVPGALAGLRSGQRRRFALPVAWAVVGLALTELAPFSFQRKVAEGLHLPICLLAAVGADAALKNRRWARALLVAIASLSNVFFVVRACGDLITNNAAYHDELVPPLYLTVDQVEAAQWLRRETPAGSVVLSSSLLGSYIPGLSGRKVYIGHWAETLDFEAKLERAVVMFQARTPEKMRLALLRDASITHVLHGPYERNIGLWDPAGSDFARLEYQNDTVRIFSLRGP